MFVSFKFKKVQKRDESKLKEVDGKKVLEKKTVNIKKEVESTTLSEHTFIYPRKSFYFCNIEHLQECFNKFFFSHLSGEEKGERRRRIK